MNSGIVVLDSFFFSPVLIYLLEDQSISKADIDKGLKELLPDFDEVIALPDTISKDGFQLKALAMGDEEFMQPDPALLHDTFLQLTERETKALEKAGHAIEIVFFGTSNHVVEKQRKINHLLYQVAQGRKVVIVDMSTFEFFNPTLWKQNRVDPFNDASLNITSQVTIHTYREEEFCRAVTLGMNKFGLPEISIKNFPCSDQNSYGSLVNATIQTLFEAPVINADSTLRIDLKSIKNIALRDFLISSCKENAKQVADVKLTAVEREEGDNYAPQMLISFENTDYSSPQEEAHELIANLFGGEDSILYTRHDEELLAASNRARLRLPELKKQLNDGLAPGYSIMVKVPFETNDGGNEWMWVEVTKWSDTAMEGILQNDPYEIKNLKAGAVVNIDESEIFDYVLTKPDGSFEGNETGKILESQDE